MASTKSLQMAAKRRLAESNRWKAPVGSVDEIQVRLLSRITVGGEPTWNGTSCWTWTRGRSRGYAVISYLGQPHSAHRLSYECFRGPIPDGLHIDHLCENTGCINPQHLEPVTAFTNTMRSSAPSALNALKTHCKRGHPFSAENTYLATSGRRVCRICNAAHRRARRAGIHVDEVVEKNLRQRRPKRQRNEPRNESGQTLYGSKSAVDVRRRMEELS